MTALIDTHTFLWVNEDSPQLSATARNIVRDRSNVIWVSPASYWELALKISRGKYRLTVPTFKELWESGFVDHDFAILPIEIRHAEVVSRLPFHHKDPFDRMLVAQALADDLTFISNDTRLDAYGVRRVW